jgi:hypothetical protein
MAKIVECVPNFSEGRNKLVSFLKLPVAVGHFSLSVISQRLVFVCVWHADHRRHIGSHTFGGRRQFTGCRPGAFD